MSDSNIYDYYVAALEKTFSHCHRVVVLPLITSSRYKYKFRFQLSFLFNTHPITFIDLFIVTLSMFPFLDNAAIMTGC